MIAESYERIHRSNLVGMGILPLQFQPGQTALSLALTGEEIYSIEGLSQAIAGRFAGGRTLTVVAEPVGGCSDSFRCVRPDRHSPGDPVL